MFDKNLYIKKITHVKFSQSLLIELLSLPSRQTMLEEISRRTITPRLCVEMSSMFAARKGITSVLSDLGFVMPYQKLTNWCVREVSAHL